MIKIHKVYLNFSVPINANTAQKLIDALVFDVPNKIDELHLVINSPGGSVPIALGIANFLESLPCKVFTYNLSRCDSAAIVLFAAGKERICVPESSFFSHCTKIVLNGEYSLDSLRLKYLALKHDYERIILFLSRKTLISCRRWKNYMMEKGHVFSAEEALRVGLATQIKEFKFCGDFKVVTIKNELKKSEE